MLAMMLAALIRAAGRAARRRYRKPLADYVGTRSERQRRDSARAMLHVSFNHTPSSQSRMTVSTHGSPSSIFGSILLTGVNRSKRAHPQSSSTSRILPRSEPFIGMPVIIVSLAKSGWFSEQRDGKNAILVPRTEPPTQGRFRHDPDVERRVLPTKTTAQVGGRNGSAERRPGLRAARAAVVKIAFSLGFALPRLSFRATRKRLKKKVFLK
jgi:hypothetical protein